MSYKNNSLWILSFIAIVIVASLFGIMAFCAPGYDTVDDVHRLNAQIDAEEQAARNLAEIAAAKNTPGTTYYGAAGDLV